MIRLPRLPAPVLRTLLDCATEEDEHDGSLVEAEFFEPSPFDRPMDREPAGCWPPGSRNTPGTRPALWWRSMPRGSPRALGPAVFWMAGSSSRANAWAGSNPAWEALAYVPCYHLGIPACWITERDVLIYSGKAADVHGRPIMPEFAKRRFPPG